MQKLIKSWDDVPVNVDTALASAITGRSPRSVRKALRVGELKGAKRGRDWIIPKTALQEYCGETGSVFKS